ncbi:MAG: aminoacyl-tRNA hydrolase [Acholeplasmatales bacterium]|jgi:PTH1 family peptidyl-tRNA hydrolase|nr:aminoacyl-tRNA hydrolase [Acholeplasmatales bacterium]
MKLIVGIGNPGPQYDNTKHNVGFKVLDFYAKENHFSFKLSKKFSALLLEVSSTREKIIFCKPLSFVNLSGEVVSKIMNFYQIESNDLLVISDDVNIELGRLRLRLEGSAGGHNGLKNIITYVGENFKRLRVGVGLNTQFSLPNYVLSQFKPEEEIILKTSMTECLKIIDDFMEGQQLRAFSLDLRSTPKLILDS